MKPSFEIESATDGSGRAGDGGAGGDPADRVPEAVLRQAILIREVEGAFLRLFSDGRLNGTVHTCVGQEFSALAFAGQLEDGDCVFSNHRCHGHYIAFTGEYRRLIAELMGKAEGVCGGVGSSQHLCAENFYSNGIQGGITPVAAGLALSRKLAGNSGIGVVFIGDGTLGEGLVYETFNLISKLEIPLLVVCEHNQYAQSTPTSATTAGDVTARAEAFGIKSYRGTTDEPARLLPAAAEAITYVRERRAPAFFLVDTVRLNAHSKGDDDRPDEEIAALQERDWLIRLGRSGDPDFVSMRASVRAEVEGVIGEIAPLPELDFAAYRGTGSGTLPEQTDWKPLEPATGQRQVALLNEAFHASMDGDPRVVFIGEDILDPYGGAFKVTRGLSDKYPDRVFSTPISEAAICGLANGLALAGMKPFVELMFGDFVTLAFDQIVNHASKFYHMYNHLATCPVVFRTPVGGGRGYGPTHSQSLDKHLLGIDNVKVVALNTLVDPRRIIAGILDEPHPVILLENKLDYGRRVGPAELPNFSTEVAGGNFPIARVRPGASAPGYTVVTYGGALAELVPSVQPVFRATESLPEIFVLSCLSSIDYRPIVESVRRTGRLVVLESGSTDAGIGSEVIASVMEQDGRSLDRSLRIGALPYPIPSVRSLEDQVLPTRSRIVQSLVEFLL